MSEKQLTDKELDSLLLASRQVVEDLGFSEAVIKRLKKRSLAVPLIPAISGALGILIVMSVLPQGEFSSIIERVTESLFSITGTPSRDLLVFLASYGIEPSLIWVFLVVPLSILPFALHQE